MTLRPVFGKTYKEIAHEWDDIALIRLKQIENGQDLSFKYVLSPLIFELLRSCNLTKVVDLGCGTGSLTKEIARCSDNVVAVDISKRNIEIAREHSFDFSNLNYVNLDIENFVLKVKESTFTTAIAAMTLMTVLDLERVLETIKIILKPGGHFVFSITHPCYWPIYWGYANADWFNYRKETPIEADFKISLDKYEECVTTHVHRPLEMYINSLSRVGFIISKIIEPIPSQDVQDKYPQKWEYPRFLGVHCILKKR